MSLFIVYTLVACTVGFVSSVLESVILSVTPAYISISIKRGNKSGLILRDLKTHLDQSLAAILTLNTLANTLGAAGVGAEIQMAYGSQTMAIASGILTFIILIFCELLPKVLGATHWKTLAPLCAYVIRVLLLVTYPMVWFSSRLKKIFTMRQNQQLTREEVIETAEISATEGILQKKESKVIKNLLMLDNIKVYDIMTPRSVAVAFEASETVGSIMKKYKPIRFSRIPVFKTDLDHIIGILHRYKLMEAASHDQDQLSVQALMDPIHTVVENVSVAAVLDLFIKRQEHLFLVVDDYGSTTGIVTLEDAIETLLGVEIVDEKDTITDMRQYALDQWRSRRQKFMTEKG